MNDVRTVLIEPAVCMQVSYYSLLPRLTHLAFGMLGSCAIQDFPSARTLLVISQFHDCISEGLIPAPMVDSLS